MSPGLKGYRINPIDLYLSFGFDQVEVSSLSSGSGTYVLLEILGAIKKITFSVAWVLIFYS